MQLEGLERYPYPGKRLGRDGLIGGEIAISFVNRVLEVCAPEKPLYIL